MKRILAFLCCLAMVLPLAACSSSLATEEAVTEAETAQTQTKEEEKETGPITYPKGFSVGYARADVTSTPMSIFESTAETVHDPLQLTCTALCDGETVALIMSLDMAGITKDLAEKTKARLEREFDIPANNILINATHTHSAATASTGGNNDAMIRWTAKYYNAAVAVTEEALRDLKPAEAFVGKDYTDGITFVRRYLLENGKYQTNPSGNVVAHESEADNELRTLRFEREGGKDVLMVNYQTHYGSATSLYPDQVSADFVHPFRERAEKELNCHFAYQSGASGNLNFVSVIPGERKYPTFVEAIDGFMETTRAAIASEEKAETGKIQVQHNDFNTKVIQDTPERIANAQIVYDAPEEDKGNLCGIYGFSSKREANAVVNRANYGESVDLPLTAISCGDIAFAAFPYEMFDTNGKEVRDGSPFKMTFVCSLTNGSYGYIPSALAVPHGGYEVVCSRFEYGSGELLVAESLRLLQLCKDAA